MIVTTKIHSTQLKNLGGEGGGGKTSLTLHMDGHND